MIFGLTDIDLNVYFRLKGPENARIRGNPYKIVVKQCRINVSKNFFSERVGVSWNSLPLSVVNFKSLRTFSRIIVNANLKLFTKYLFSPSASEFISDLCCTCELFFIFYRVLLLFLFMAYQWHCPLPDI